MGSISERDWKYLRSIKDDLLATLCAHINRQAQEILQRPHVAEAEKYRQLYRHMEASDQIVAECFDDWRRSTMWITVRILAGHGLLQSEHIRHLTEGAQALVADCELPESRGVG